MEGFMNPILKNQRIKLDEGKSISVGVHTVHLHHPVHWHSFFEIEIILSGEGKYVVNDVEYDISENNVFFLTSTDFHYLRLDGTAQIMNISFDETMMSDADMTTLVFNKIAKAYKLDGDEYRRVLDIARILEHECGVDGDCCGALLSYIIKCLFRKSKDEPRADITPETLGGIRRAIIYMELHFRENIDLDAVASEAGYTSAYFSRLFRKATGKSYIETLTQYRLGYAKTLLGNGFSVTDTCFSSGFGSLTSFQEAFKRKYKISPREYKRSLECKGE
jgi:AraC-like DNA-binding protein/quercetin dioxygenase-like cupin family protein